MSAIDLAREAVRFAATLTPRQRHTLITGEPAHATVYRNLRMLDLVERQGGPAKYRPTVLTNLGRVVAMVLNHGADEVLARAGREQAALHIEISRDVVIFETPAMTAGDDDVATVAFRTAILDHIHGLAKADNEQWEAGRQAAAEYFTRGIPVRLLGETLDATADYPPDPYVRGRHTAMMDTLHGLAIVDYARHEAAALFATGVDEVAVGNILDVIRGAKLTPMMAAFRAAVMDILHTRARALYAAHLDPIAPAALLPAADDDASWHVIGTFATTDQERDAARAELAAEREAAGDPHATHTGARNACPDDRCRAHAAGTRLYVVPTDGPRLSDRHDVLGPYNTDELAERIRDRYRAEGIACDIVRSATRPVLQSPEGLS